MRVMEMSFLLSDDEVFTLMSLAPGRTEAGQSFADGALDGAKLCDLSGLVDKSLARRSGDELELIPVIRMVADALSRADFALRDGEVWEVGSPWLNLLCERYAFRDGYWKITPMKAEPR